MHKEEIDKESAEATDAVADTFLLLDVEMQAKNFHLFHRLMMMANRIRKLLFQVAQLLDDIVHLKRTLRAKDKHIASLETHVKHLEKVASANKPSSTEGSKQI